MTGARNAQCSRGSGSGLSLGGAAGPLVDPSPDQVDLRRAQGLAVGGRGHAPLALLGDQVDERALVTLAGEDRRARRSIGHERLHGVDAELGLLLEGAVAGVAAGRQDRPDLLRVVDGLGRQERVRDEEGPGGCQSNEDEAHGMDLRLGMMRRQGVASEEGRASISRAGRRRGAFPPRSPGTV